ncbi:hypothetical protein CRV24_007041 [Beauveria bassiana]|nr:hypothetical protein CRV24_007041 [Beauveria bassiana]
MSWLGVTPLKKFPAPFLRKCKLEVDDSAYRDSANQLRESDIQCGSGIRSQSRLNMLTRPAGAVIAYGANSAQNSMMASDQWKNDPRNPNAKTAGGH